MRINVSSGACRVLQSKTFFCRFANFYLRKQIENPPKADIEKVKVIETATTWRIRFDETPGSFTLLSFVEVNAVDELVLSGAEPLRHQFGILAFETHFFGFH